MPQLDVSTYLGQVTWFTLVFRVFYGTMTYSVLPALNRAVKMRTKKVERTRGDARQFDGARAAAESSYDHAGQVASLEVLGILGRARTRVDALSRKRFAILVESQRKHSTAAGSSSQSAGGDASTSDVKKASKAAKASKAVETDPAVTSSKTTPASAAPAKATASRKPKAVTAEDSAAPAASRKPKKAKA